MMNGIKSRAQDGYALVKKININMLAPSLDEDWNTWLSVQREQLKRFKSIILLNLSK